MSQDDNKGEKNKFFHKSSQQVLEQLSYWPSSLILHNAVWRSVPVRESLLFPGTFQRAISTVKHILIKSHSLIPIAER